MAKNKTAAFVRSVKLAATLIMVLLAVRVADLQGFRGSFFRNISEQNRQFRVDIPAERGVFLDRYGDPIVVNTRQYFRYDDPLALYSQTTLLPQSEALAAQVTAPFSVGYSLQRRTARSFSLSHVLGYVSVVNPQDLVRDATLSLTDSVGRLGLEQQYDDLLRGRDGFQEFEVNALGEKQAAQASQFPVVGQPLSTTLDPYLSTAAWRAMGSKTGAVVILDAQTGKILSLVSTPSFDSNLFASIGPDQDQQRVSQLQEALSDERKLFFNRAVSGLYPPGSIFKLVTAVAGLEGGAFDLNTTVDDQGSIEAGGSTFANWYFTQYGRVEGVISLVRAITRSNDTFFYKAAEWTGVEKLTQKAREFGFGEASGIEIPGEKAGLVPDPEWKEKTFGERWFLGNTYHLGIGQGDLLVTPLQLARMIAVFGNGGQVCQTSVVATQAGGQSASQCSDLGISDATLAAVREGMIGACSAGGTAFPFFDWNTIRKSQLPEGLTPGQQISQGVVACKTGTAEFGGSSNELGHKRTHGWFGMTVGGLDELLSAELIADPIEATASAMTADENSLDLAAEHQRWLNKVRTTGFPDTITILVLVESDEEQPFMEGSRDAGPIVRQIFNWMLGSAPNL